MASASAVAGAAAGCGASSGLSRLDAEPVASPWLALEGVEGMPVSTSCGTFDGTFTVASPWLPVDGAVAPAAGPASAEPDPDGGATLSVRVSSFWSGVCGMSRLMLWLPSPDG